MLKRLPVLFICENNLYSVYSPLRVRQPQSRAIHAMAAALGMASSQGDGNDAGEVYAQVSKGVRAIRAGEGPRFFEFATYRWREHCGPLFDNDIGYRTEAEFLAWKANDPLTRLQSALDAEGALSDDDIALMDHEIATEVDAAFAFAEASPFPDAADAFTDVYASERGARRHPA